MWNKCNYCFKQSWHTNQTNRRYTKIIFCKENVALIKRHKKVEMSRWHLYTLNARWYRQECRLCDFCNHTPIKRTIAWIFLHLCQSWSQGMHLTLASDLIVYLQTDSAANFIQIPERTAAEKQTNPKLLAKITVLAHHQMLWQVRA